MQKWMIGAAVGAMLAIAPAFAQTAVTAQADVNAHAGHGSHMGNMGRMDRGPQTRGDVSAKVAAHFAKVDANKDNVITKAEVDAAHQQMMAKWQARADKRAERHDPAAMMAKFDSNKDGQITKAEADAVMAARAADKGRPARTSERLFAHIDANKDGAITSAELTTMHAQRGQHGEMGKMGHGGHMRGMGKGMAMGMFDRADTDKDGKVTLAEAQQAALAHFDMADANKDGQVTREERKAMWAQHMGKHQS